jgi:hypothetical protein
MTVQFVDVNQSQIAKLLAAKLGRSHNWSTLRMNATFTMSTPTLAQGDLIRA